MPEIPGSTVQAFCVACDSDQDHTVLEVLDGGKRIGKVRCGKCREEHAFRRPRSSPRPSAAARAGRPSRPKRTSGKSSRSRTPGEPTAAEAWAAAQPTLLAATKVKYAMDVAFDRNQVIDHPTFGVGLVTAVLAPNKIEVLFADGRRKLACGQGAS